MTRLFRQTFRIGMAGLAVLILPLGCSVPECKPGATGSNCSHISEVEAARRLVDDGLALLSTDPAAADSKFAEAIVLLEGLDDDLQTAPAASLRAAAYSLRGGFNIKSLVLELAGNPATDITQALQSALPGADAAGFADKRTYIETAARIAASDPLAGKADYNLQRILYSTAAFILVMKQTSLITSDGKFSPESVKDLSAEDLLGIANNIDSALAAATGGDPNDPIAIKAQAALPSLASKSEDEKKECIRQFLASQSGGEKVGAECKK